jgi:thiamine-monophosphate kinase
MSKGEDQITAWFAEHGKLSADEFPIGIGDDMAEVRIGSESVLITTDILLDGVHFDLAGAGAEQVGYKAMAVSMSDCAAMATEPLAAVVSVGLCAGFGAEQLKELHKGIVRAGERYGCKLIGGDITAWKGGGRFVISVAMLSKRAGCEPVRRSGAGAGDVICVTGTLGGSYHGKHLTFEPRVREAIAIAKIVTLNSMMDISDGLSSDLNRICLQSGVGAVIEAELIPISEQAKNSDDPLSAALNDGEDFELLFTLSRADYDKLIRKWPGDLRITRIGAVTEEKKLLIKNADGKIQDLEIKGFDHLSDD